MWFFLYISWFLWRLLDVQVKDDIKNYTDCDWEHRAVRRGGSYHQEMPGRRCGKYTIFDYAGTWTDIVQISKGFTMALAGYHFSSFDIVLDLASGKSGYMQCPQEMNCLFWGSLFPLHTYVILYIYVQKTLCILIIRYTHIHIGVYQKLWFNNLSNVINHVKDNEMLKFVFRLIILIHFWCWMNSLLTHQQDSLIIHIEDLNWWVEWP